MPAALTHVSGLLVPHLPDDRPSYSTKPGKWCSLIYYSPQGVSIISAFKDEIELDELSCLVLDA